MGRYGAVLVWLDGGGEEAMLFPELSLRLVASAGVPVGVGGGAPPHIGAAGGQALGAVRSGQKEPPGSGFGGGSDRLRLRLG